MGNRLSFGAEGTHEAEILQSPSTKDEAKAASGYSLSSTVTEIWRLKDNGVTSLTFWGHVTSSVT